jgi:flagellin-like protein
LRLRRSRKAISELVGSMLAIAITIIAGSAVFGYVNSQAGLTEQQLGAGVGGTVNYLQEKFAVVDVNFISSSSVAVYIYNSGRVQLSPVQVYVYDSARSSLYVSYNASEVAYTTPNCGGVSATTSNENPLLWNAQTGSGLSVPVQSFQTLTLTLPTCSGASFSSGASYIFRIVGLYGNVETYTQTR